MTLETTEDDEIDIIVNTTMENRTQLFGKNSLNTGKKLSLDQILHSINREFHYMRI